MKEHIISAAVYHGCIWSLPKPARHGNILDMIHRTFFNRGVDFEAVSVPPENQGFLTSTGRFVNRSEAMTIAYQANQLNDRHHTNELFSEDLW